MERVDRAVPAMHREVRIVGEDATSGFHHLFAREGGRLRRARIVWNGGCCAAPTVDDYYLAGGELVAVRSWVANLRDLPALARGEEPPRRAVAQLAFRRRRLVAWRGAGAGRARSAAWRERERAHLATVDALVRD